MIDAKAVQTDQDLLSELETRRDELREWHERESEYSREGMAARAEREAIETEIRKMVNADPLLIDGDGKPVSKTNAVGKAMARLAKSPDPDGIFRRRDHANAVVTKLARDLEGFILENFAALNRARYAEAVEVREAVMQHRDAYLAATERYLGFAQETVALCSPHPEYNGQHVAGIDEGSELRRALERVADLPLPTIHGSGPEIETKPEPVFFERPKEDEDE